MEKVAEDRVLILLPRGRDSKVAAGILAKAGFRSHVCTDLTALARAAAEGAGTALVAEEALDDYSGERGLLHWVTTQPPWSDLPFVVLAVPRGDLAQGSRLPPWFEAIGNTVLLERPFGTAALASAIRVALRARRKQYELRGYLAERELAAERLAALNASLERRVSESLRERDRIWSNSRDLLVVADATGVFRELNPAWTTLLGWLPKELIGHDFLEFLHSEDYASSLQATAVPAGLGAESFTNRFKHKDGSYRWLSWRTVPEGNLIYATARDVTSEIKQAEALQQAEEALRQSQKMEAIGQLTGGVAHDFNNLLTVIRSSVDLLKRPNLTEERRQRYVAAISDTATRATKLTSQLLAFARRQSLKPEVFDIAESVKAISGMVVTLTGSRIGIETRVADEPWFVNADPSQFDTALINLAVNARDAMNGDGTLIITVCTASTIPPMRAHPAIIGDFVAVSITDTGAGIAPDDLDRIFEPFFTTKSVGQGTGLGLSQVFGFVKQSGGQVGVKSELGKGTTFTLYLPRVAGEGRLPTPKTGEVPSLDGHGICVLVVEDNADVGSFATQTLEELGYRSILATGAEAALIELRNDSDRFDVVFSDVMMPGMNGIDLAHEIRRRYTDLPIVLTSGYSHVLASNGPEDFELLHKPYSIEQISRALTKAAHWRRLRRVVDI